MQVDAPKKPPIVLESQLGEVTGVSWCPTDLGQIATCHDSACISVWGLDRASSPARGPPRVQHRPGGQAKNMQASSLL
jgi:hypothetical protein